MIQIFRGLSLLEGLSYLVILSVSFGLISREYVFVLGMGHGVLFVLYLLMSLLLSSRMGWSLFRWLLLFIAAVVPLAFLAVEVFLRRQIAAQPASPQA